MKAPEHSVEPPGPAGEDRFASRNNFLFFLLGVIASAERVLGVLPQAVGADEGPAAAPDAPPAARPAPRGDEGLLR